MPRQSVIRSCFYSFSDPCTRRPIIIYSVWQSLICWRSCLVSTYTCGSFLLLIKHINLHAAECHTVWNSHVGDGVSGEKKMLMKIWCRCDFSLNVCLTQLLLCSRHFQGGDPNYYCVDCLKVQTWKRRRELDGCFCSCEGNTWRCLIIHNVLLVVIWLMVF